MPATALPISKGNPGSTTTVVVYITENNLVHQIRAMSFVLGILDD